MIACPARRARYLPPVSVCRGVLALTLVVRDEEDILAANLDYHLAQGVDVILVVDHGSVDRTPAILAEYASGGRVRWFRDEERAHLQASRVNRLLQIAAEEHHADWVIHCDADEFWVPVAGSLRDVFEAILDRYGYIQPRRTDFLPAPDNGEPFHQRMVVCYRHTLNLRGTTLEPKIAQRPGAGASLAPGNHYLEEPLMEMAPDIGALEVWHFPLRTFEQFERKVVKMGIGIECDKSRAPGVSCDQLALFDLWRRGELFAYYQAKALDAAAIERGLESGELVIDRRLQNFLGAPDPCALSSLAFADLLRRTWTGYAQASDALSDAELRAQAQQARLDEQQAALEAQQASLAAQQASLDARRVELDRVIRDRDLRVAGLTSELASIRRQSEELRGTLEVVRNSRIMRYSAPARRAYYRIRT